MKMQSKALFTMICIFGAAYVLAASGCADSGGSGDNKNLPNSVGQDSNNTTEDSVVLTPLKPDQVRECTNSEFAQLISWRNTLDKANSDIDVAKGKQVQSAIQSSVAAINSCDSRLAYHKVEPCKKTKKTIIGTEVRVYDAFLIKRDCAKVESYLNKYNLRPAPGISPTPSQPMPQPNPSPQPLPLEPVSPDSAINNPSTGTLNACSQDEFSKLSEWSQNQDRATKSLAKLGSESNWKYDVQTILNVSSAVKQCESLMKYHSTSPCEKNIKQTDGSVIKRQYTRDSIGDRCVTSRKYFYEYVQNKSTLIFPNVDLFVDLRNFGQQRFEPQSFTNLGACVVENRTDNVIDYTDRKALVVETRGFEQKMLVLITTEGLKVDCYGLDIGEAFSKTEIVKVLKAEGTDLRLEYRLK